MVAEGWEIREEITAKFLFFSSQCAMDFEWTLILSWLLFSTRNSFCFKTPQTQEIQTTTKNNQLYLRGYHQIKPYHFSFQKTGTNRHRHRRWVRSTRFMATVVLVIFVQSIYMGVLDFVCEQWPRTHTITWDERYIYLSMNGWFLWFFM